MITAAVIVGITGMMTSDLLLISEVHATLSPELSSQRVREKLIQCSLELSGENEACTILMFRAMGVALRDGDVQEYLGRNLKKLVDSI